MIAVSHGFIDNRLHFQRYGFGIGFRKVRIRRLHGFFGKSFHIVRHVLNDAVGIFHPGNSVIDVLPVLIIFVFSDAVAHKTGVSNGVVTALVNLGTVRLFKKLLLFLIGSVQRSFIVMHELHAAHTNCHVNHLPTTPVLLTSFSKHSSIALRQREQAPNPFWYLIMFESSSFQSTPAVESRQF